MTGVSSQQKFALAAIATVAFVYFIVVYAYPQITMNRPTATPMPASVYETDVAAFLKGQPVTHVFDTDELDHRREIDVNGEDVLVFIRVQKTGTGFLDNVLINTLQVDPPCQCIWIKKRPRCTCLNSDKKVWLFTARSTHWGCGVHADWTETMACLDDWFDDKGDTRQRIYHLITSVRNPVDRFFSEWQHVSRGATWKGSTLRCNGRSPTSEEVPSCFQGSDWKGVSFDVFFTCPSNLAFNRMTRMFSDLTLVNCYNRSHLDPEEVNKIMLASAKENLANFAFYFILEYPRESQFLFERTFGISFNMTIEERLDTHVSSLGVTEVMLEEVVESNKLDISLYQFAIDLFWQRVRNMEVFMGCTVDQYFDHVRKVVHLNKENVAGNEYDDDDDDNNKKKKKDDDDEKEKEKESDSIKEDNVGKLVSVLTRKNNS